MNSYPDFSEHGYQVLRELGRNREGGRITWLASKVNTGEQMVIKQFCFAQAGSNWSGFEAHQREIKVLQGLTHPGIPRYINSFATSDGFCLVQEYINAQSLAELVGKFEIEEVKQIAVKALEILRYLQILNPPVIHRDIKPENILVDEERNVYIIDFGFARIGSQEVAASSVFKGTPGFIPPEQMFKPTDATDLYALGVTLICLLTGIKSTRIDQLQDQDDPYLIKFHHLLPRLNLRFLGWLEKMVQPLQKNRFANAQSALEALKPLDVIRVAGVDFSETVLEFKANRLGEKLTQSITVENLISDTLLEGRWEVAPHPNDPPHTPDDHAWISVTPAQFSGNHTWCPVEVDTSKLMADKQYKRQLILHSNAYPATHTLTVKVQTAALPIETREVPYAWLASVLLIGAIASLSMTWFITVAGLGTVIKAVIGAVIGSVGGALSGMFIVGLMIDLILMLLFESDGFFAAKMMGVMGFFVGLPIGAVWLLLNTDSRIGIGIGIGIGIWIIFMLLAVWKANIFINQYKYKDYTWSKSWFETWSETWQGNANLRNIAMLSSLTAALGTSFGILCIVGLTNPYILFVLAGTGLPLVSMLLYSPLKRRRLIAKYRQSEESLIKP
ncbi:MAG: serine/threonine-protein kinase [Nostoc sp.]|uniref:serine/threonine protein kinase n=1 Tax=Nostoc sp. TaxID=1180 RepID=UPI002FF7A4B8